MEEDENIMYAEIKNGRESILRAWEEESFFLPAVQYYYLDNKKAVFKFLLDNEDLKDMIVIRKYLEALLVTDCLKYAYDVDLKNVREIIDSSQKGLTDEEIRYEFSKALYNNIIAHLKKIIWECPYPDYYIEEILEHYYNQVKDDFEQEEKRYGTCFRGREVLNYWVELGIWFNPDALPFMRVDASSDLVEANLRDKITDIIFYSYYDCSYKLQRALYCYICEKDEYYLYHHYDVNFYRYNSLEDISNMDLDEDRDKIFKVVVSYIRDLVAEHAADEICGDDPDTFLAPGPGEKSVVMSDDF